MPAQDESGARDDWDIVSGVGATALAVAGARAAESRRDDRLVEDPFAERLFAAAPMPDGMSLMFEGDTGAELMATMSGYLGLRSRVFDDFFAQQAENGVRQAVILASGLDTRAFRLEWPEGFHVFEIDQPQVLEFKTSVLDGLGAKPQCAWEPVAVDLRDDWETSLRAAGFDPSAPTAWLAEGLLPYLPAAAETALLSTVSALSAPGSAIAVESFAGQSFSSTMPALADEAKRAGFDISQLFSTEERPEPGGALAEFGWDVRRELVGAASGRFERDLGGVRELIGDKGEFLTAARAR